MFEQINEEKEQDFNEDIAIIGMVGRFPDADDMDMFWHNLSEGVESVKLISGETLRKRGFGKFVDENPNYVSSEACLSDELVKNFDASFFNISPREAEIMDPQHRLFLEACWELFEHAGYSMEHYGGRVGVFGSTGFSGYLESNLLPNRELLQQVGSFQTQLGNDKDFIATRVSYKMGFTGSSMSVSTLCSSAAVAIHMARESLLNYQNDIVLAGGVNISVSTSDSLYYQEGGIGAGDGKCRAYDERASGTVAGSGLGVIALKRLDDAIQDNDNILAVIKGSAINNDGSDKASYTAPSPEGQAQVISEALAVAGVNPETIGFIDGHGTATNIGDPIEISALTKAYRMHTDKTQYCGIGSVKTNIGHLVTAGGIASLIKMVLSLQHKKMPPSLNFERPNPKIDFANSPFYVNDQLKDWQAHADFPRRGAISSFGIGGTNVHIILEEAPERQKNKNHKSQPLAVILSAKTESALIKQKRNLSKFLANNPNIPLEDLVYTLKVGRNTFEHKFYTVCDSIASLRQQLDGVDVPMTAVRRTKANERNIAFMFPGQGTQYLNMARGLYDSEPVFKDEIDLCCRLAKELGGVDLRATLFDSTDESSSLIANTQYAQISLFSVEYALAKLWISQGIKPNFLIGHSLGELSAACLAGIFSLEDGIKAVCQRGKLMAAQPAGVMLSVAASAEQLQQHLSEDVELAAINGAMACVLAGSENSILQVETELMKQGIGTKRLKTSHAFHSASMIPAQEEFVRFMSDIELHEPQIPLVSNVTGEWMTKEQATSHQYWGEQLRSKVMFAKGIGLLTQDSDNLLLEVGPGKTLCTFAAMANHDKHLIIESLPFHENADMDKFYKTMAEAHIWGAGMKVEWNKVYDENKPRRVPLPTYPFERKPFWVESIPYGQTASVSSLEFLDEDSLYNHLNENRDNSKISLSIQLDSAVAKTVTSEKLFSLRNEIVALLEQHKLDSEVSPVVVSTSIQSQSHTQLDTGKQSVSTDEPSLSYREPISDIEKGLVKDWETALGTSPIGLDDNFFELNGHSLIAATLVNKIKQNYGVDVGLGDFLDEPTVAGVAGVIQTKLWLEQQSNETNEHFEDEDTLVL